MATTCTTPSGETVTTYPISNADLPGYTSPDHGGDTRRVFDPSGAYIGTVTYASRRRRHDARIGTYTEYGWRTASGRKLTTLTDAIRRLTTA